MDKNKLLSITVKGPKREEFKGFAHSVTSINKKGKFDVLPYHENFISLVRDYVIIIREDKKQITFPIDKGVIRVFGDKVNILIGV